MINYHYLYIKRLLKLIILLNLGLLLSSCQEETEESSKEVTQETVEEILQEDKENLKPEKTPKDTLAKITKSTIKEAKKVRIDTIFGSKTKP